MGSAGVWCSTRSLEQARNSSLSKSELAQCWGPPGTRKPVRGVLVVVETGSNRLRALGRDLWELVPPARAL